MKVEHRLQYGAKLSTKQASEKILAHAQFGNHQQNFRPSNEGELSTYFAQLGINFSNVIEECRDSSRTVPDFENTVRSPRLASGDGVTVIGSPRDISVKAERSGHLMASSYQDHFEAACSARDKAVRQGSVAAFHECLSQGFASIGALLNTEVTRWNKRLTHSPLLAPEGCEMGLENKLTDWLPILSGDKQLDRAGHSWNDFKKLKKLRDEHAIDEKQSAHSMSYKKLARNIDYFRYGIAQILWDMHLLLGKPVPAAIINAVYEPDIEVVDITLT